MYAYIYIYIYVWLHPLRCPIFLDMDNRCDANQVNAASNIPSPNECHALSNAPPSFLECRISSGAQKYLHARVASTQPQYIQCQLDRVSINLSFWALTLGIVPLSPSQRAPCPAPAPAPATAIGAGHVHALRAAKTAGPCHPPCSWTAGRSSSGPRTACHPSHRSRSRRPRRVCKMDFMTGMDPHTNVQGGGVGKRQV